MSGARNYFDWQARTLAPYLGRRVVEVGCGTGNFTRTLLDREAVIAVDIEAACVEGLRQRFQGQQNLTTFVCGPGDAAFAGLKRFEPDCCVCLNVLEHIEDDAEALARMSEILSPGGVVVILVPAFPCLYGPIDGHLGHYRRYTRRSVSALSNRAGLTVRTLKYMNAAGFFGWWANARLFRRQAQSPAQIRAFDRFVVPVASRIESIVAPPFGQSIVAVLTRSDVQ